MRRVSRLVSFPHHQLLLLYTPHPILVDEHKFVYYILDDNPRMVRSEFFKICCIEILQLECILLLRFFLHLIWGGHSDIIWFSLVWFGSVIFQFFVSSIRFGSADSVWIWTQITHFILKKIKFVYTLNFSKYKNKKIIYNI